MRGRDWGGSEERRILQSAVDVKGIHRPGLELGLREETNRRSIMTASILDKT